MDSCGVRRSCAATFWKQGDFGMVNCTQATAPSNPWQFAIDPMNKLNLLNLSLMTIGDQLDRFGRIWHGSTLASRPDVLVDV